MEPIALIPVGLSRRAVQHQGKASQGKGSKNLFPATDLLGRPQACAQNSQGKRMTQVAALACLVSHGQAVPANSRPGSCLALAVVGQVGLPLAVAAPTVALAGLGGAVVPRPSSYPSIADVPRKAEN